MRINIIVPSITSLNINKDGANVQGDELMARSWVKYLSLDKRISKVDLNGSGKYDISISFNPTIESRCPASYRILYLQNTFPESKFPGGIVSVFKHIKNRYDAFIFPSCILIEKLNTDGLICPFAADTDLFFPRTPEDRLAHNLCFVGNNLRGLEINEKYLFCVQSKGLVIYGNPYGWNHPCCVGKLSVEDEPVLYSSAQICLNSHMKEHLETGVFNFRIFNILACGGFIISDKSEYLVKEFENSIVFSEGGEDLRKLVDFYLQNPQETIKYRKHGYNYVLSKHTFKHRIDSVLKWLKI